nr:malate synthase A [uncultured Arsenicibacter sp.]
MVAEQIKSTLVLQGHEDVLTQDAIDFLSFLHAKFNKRRKELLIARDVRQARINAGERPDFLKQTQFVREADWQVGYIPGDLQLRRVEITGPVDRKMIVNALNSGANVFMADFEDANAPTWTNLMDGQRNLSDAIRRQIDFTAENGKTYVLNEQVATLLVRPRGWHLEEKHLLVNGEPIAASIFDFGLYLFRNAHELLQRGSGPYFYLPKLENHVEARLWNDLFIDAQRYLGLETGTIKATVLIETILAAFEMDEILYELRQHIVGLNAGRWDYIFSFIKKFNAWPGFTLPDRAAVTMQVPFMKAYTQLLVQTCHRRGAHAIGGMSAFIPNRRDPAVNEQALARVKADKEHEANLGFDGTWVAHPDLVPVAREPFDRLLGPRLHQKEVSGQELRITAKDLLNYTIPGATITEAGIRMNISVGILYIESWLRGIGAVAIHNLMEDAATAEISRAQLWQWLHHQAHTNDGTIIDELYYRRLLAEELHTIRKLTGEAAFAAGQFEKATALFDRLVSQPTFENFLTLGAYAELA